MFRLAYGSQGWPIQQGTQEWLDTRQYYITGTSAHQLLSSDTTRLTLAARLLAAYDLRNPADAPFQSERMNKAHEDEKAAVVEYAFTHDVEVEHTNDFLISNRYLFAALSPDGVIYTGTPESTLEIKALNADNHIKTILKDDIDKAYFHQCEWSLFVTGAKSCTYHGFCPELNKFRAYEKTIFLSDARRKEIEKIYLTFEDKLLTLFNQYGVSYEQEIPNHSH